MTILINQILSGASTADLLRGELNDMACEWARHDLYLGRLPDDFEKFYTEIIKVAEGWAVKVTARPSGSILIVTVRELFKWHEESVDVDRLMQLIDYRFV